MATTPIYGFQTPDDTDLVKDGALAIRTALDDVDTTLGTALNSNDYAGLVLVKKQTIGSGVSTVTVTNAFTATYDNYKIVVSGGTSNVNSQLDLKLGATATGYYSGLNYLVYASSAISGLGNSNGTAFFYAGFTHTAGHQVNIDLFNPFATKVTGFNSVYIGNAGSGSNAGYLNNSTSYTDFTLTTTAALTGGTIYVYGYGAS